MLFLFIFLLDRLIAEEGRGEGRLGAGKGREGEVVPAARRDTDFQGGDKLISDLNCLV